MVVVVIHHVVSGVMPVAAVPAAIYFDTDASGDFSAGDTPYNPGSNDPSLAPAALAIPGATIEY